ncbi:MAG: NAD-dependent epimerase/dehydratase family protein [Candidatus Heimdallarchaeota archaeon]
MKIAVIGGSGFIGSHIVDKLVQEDHEVTVFDIMKPSRTDLRHIHIDITDLSNTAVALTGEYDALYLLAAMANVNDVFANPVESGLVNVMGPLNVLEAARRNDIGRVILASTVWVYGLSPENKVDEKTPLLPENVDHVYTGSKISAELLFYSFSKLYGINYTILRYGIPYGPRARTGTVITNFVRFALEGKALTILGDGNQSRNFIYVEDLAEGNVAALNEGGKNQTFNLEGPEEISVRRVAETVQKLIGNVEIIYQEARPGDFVGKIISNEKSKNLLGWEPRTSFEEGLTKYIHWFRDNNK